MEISFIMKQSNMKRVKNSKHMTKKRNYVANSSNLILECILLAKMLVVAQ